MNAIAVPLGILQALQQKYRRTLTHHKSIRSIGIRAGSRRRKRSNLAEFHKTRCAHIGIDATGQHRIKIAFIQTFNRRCHRSHSGCTRRVAGIIGAM